MKKILLTLLAACFPMIAMAQVKHLPFNETLEVSTASIAPLFDRETVKLLNVIKTTQTQHHVDGLLIKYAIVNPAEFAQALSEKSDDEADKHYYYGYAYDHETEYIGKYGVAFYLKENDQYVLQFSNDAFLFESLGGLSAYNGLESEGDEVIVDIMWTNTLVGPTYSRYYFLYDQEEKYWHLNRFIDLESSIHPPNYQYKGCAFDKGISMQAFSMEVFLKEMPAINPHTLCLTYSSDSRAVLEDGVGDDGFANFYQQIETIKNQGKGPLLNKLLKDSDIAQFIFGQDYYSGNNQFYIGDNVLGMNNLAYLLEQMDCLDFAQTLLEGIVLEAPQRTVAYINLGDVYRKQGQVDKAKQAYSTYSDLMKKEGRQARIPQRVKTYIESATE